MAFLPIRWMPVSLFAAVLASLHLHQRVTTVGGVQFGAAAASRAGNRVVLQQQRSADGHEDENNLQRSSSAQREDPLSDHEQKKRSCFATVIRAAGLVRFRAYLDALVSFAQGLEEGANCRPRRKQNYRQVQAVAQLQDQFEDDFQEACVRLGSAAALFVLMAPKEEDLDEFMREAGSRMRALYEARPDEIRGRGLRWPPRGQKEKLPVELKQRVLNALEPKNVLAQLDAGFPAKTAEQVRLKEAWQRLVAEDVGDYGQCVLEAKLLARQNAAGGWRLPESAARELAKARLAEDDDRLRRTFGLQLHLGLGALAPPPGLESEPAPAAVAPTSSCSQSHSPLCVDAYAYAYPPHDACAPRPRPAYISTLRTRSSSPSNHVDTTAPPPWLLGGATDNGGGVFCGIIDVDNIARLGFRGGEGDSLGDLRPRPTRQFVELNAQVDMREKLDRSRAGRSDATLARNAVKCTSRERPGKKMAPAAPVAPLPAGRVSRLVQTSALEQKPEHQFQFQHADPVEVAEHVRTYLDHGGTLDAQQEKALRDHAARTIQAEARGGRKSRTALPGRGGQQQPVHLDWLD